MCVLSLAKLTSAARPADAQDLTATTPCGPSINGHEVVFDATALPAGSYTDGLGAEALPADVSVVLYDVLGREAAVVHRGRLDGGAHRLSVDAAVLPAGTYVVRAQVGSRAALVRTFTVAR